MSEPVGASEQVRIQCATSPGFEAWLAEAGGSLALSTYQAGKVAMIGWDGRQITLLMRQFEKPLGMAVEGNRIAVATRNDVTVFANAPDLARDYLPDQPGRYDAIYLPRVTYHTNDLNTHDVAFVDGEPLLVNTRFSCLARPSVEHSFVPVWKPSFVSELAPEDRCHLNGLALREGRPKFVTALGTTDEAGAWRARKASGGVTIDVETGSIVVDGLSMPHSPRWHDGRLWVLNSGAGELLAIDLESGRGDTVCRLPGYLRGLSFVGPFALVGLSRIRERHIFGGLPVQQRCERLRCGVAVVDLRSGTETALFEFTAGCDEVYDVQFLPGVFRPTILNLERPATREAFVYPEASWWLRPGAELREGAGKTGGGQPPIQSAEVALATGIAFSSRA